MATSAQVDYGALGKQRFDNFCRTVNQLIDDKDNQFDLLVAGGNSGVALAAFTELIYQVRGLPMPAKLSIPLYRYQPGHRDDPGYRLDVSSLLGMVSTQLASIASA